MLAFPGALLHGGDPVTSGTRYILAVFLLVSSHRPDQLSSSILPDEDFMASLSGSVSSASAPGETFGSEVSSLHQELSTSAVTDATGSETSGAFSNSESFSFGFDFV